MEYGHAWHETDDGAIGPAELPENAPRYVLLSHELNHDDGRKSFPLVLINWAPRSSEMSLLTLHASGFIDFQNTVRIVHWSTVHGYSLRITSECRLM